MLLMLFVLSLIAPLSVRVSLLLHSELLLLRKHKFDKIVCIETLDAYGISDIEDIESYVAILKKYLKRNGLLMLQLITRKTEISPSLSKDSIALKEDSIIDRFYGVLGSFASSCFSSIATYVVNPFELEKRHQWITDHSLPSSLIWPSNFPSFNELIKVLFENHLASVEMIGDGYLSVIDQWKEKIDSAQNYNHRFLEELQLTEEEVRVWKFHFDLFKAEFASSILDVALLILKSQ